MHLRRSPAQSGSLSEAEVATHYTVSGIYERDRGLLEFLEHRGIRPGAKLRVLAHNYDQTLTLSTPAGTVSLGPAASNRVWLSPLAGTRH